MASLPSLIIHLHVRQHYMKHAQEGGENVSERETEQENVHSLPDRRLTEIPNTVIVIKVNWLQLDG